MVKLVLILRKNVTLFGFHETTGVRCHCGTASTLLPQYYKLTGEDVVMCIEVAWENRSGHGSPRNSRTRLENIDIFEFYINKISIFKKKVIKQT